HATRNEPPPFDAATRGNRQMLPVPTAMPSIASIVAQRLENSSGRLTCHPPSSEFAAVRPVFIENGGRGRGRPRHSPVPPGRGRGRSGRKPGGGIRAGIQIQRQTPPPAVYPK